MKPLSLSVQSLPKLSERSTTFLTSSTDDMSFAMSQISKIHKKQYLHQQYSGKPWEQNNTKTNIYGENGKSNFGVLKDFKKRPGKPLNAISWANNNYFNRSELDSVFEGSQICKIINNKKEGKEPYTDLHTYSTQCKEICVKNMLLELMNEERHKGSGVYAEKEQAIVNELSTLKKETQAFEEYKNEGYHSGKNSEHELNRMVLESKKLFDNKKKVTQEHRSLLDEIEKTVRSIINMKYYAIFVHSVGGGENTGLNCTLSDTLEIKTSREKDLDDYSKLIFKELGSLNDINITGQSNVLADPEEGMMIYNQYQENILKLINEKEDYNKEGKMLKEKYQNNMQNLLLKVNTHQEDGHIFKKFENRINEEIKLGQYMSPQNEFIPTAIEGFNDGEETILPGCRIDVTKAASIERNVIKVIQRVVGACDDIERRVDVNLEYLESICNDPLFDVCLESLKEENKMKRYLNEKNGREKKAESQAKLINNKTNQYKIKGRGRAHDPIPPNLVQQFKRKKVKINKEVADDDQMLYYEVTEN